MYISVQCQTWVHGQIKNLSLVKNRIRQLWQGFFQILDQKMISNKQGGGIRTKQNEEWWGPIETLVVVLHPHLVIIKYSISSGGFWICYLTLPQKVHHKLKTPLCLFCLLPLLEQLQRSCHQLHLETLPIHTHQIGPFQYKSGADHKL